MKFGVALTLSLLALCNATLKEEEADAAEYLKNKDQEILVQQRLAVLATWDYETNITAATEKADNDAAVVLSTFMQTVTSHLKTYNWTFFESADTKRQIKSLTNPQTAILSTDDYGKFKAIVNNMSTIYSTATVCDYTNRTKCDLPLDPDLRNIFSDNRVPQELAYYWTQWYDHFAPVRGEYKQYVDLSNKAAKMNNFSTAAESWLDEYEDNTFEDQLDQILVRLRPIYEQIHGYVRDKLNKFYGDDVVSKTGPIPMHLLGNPWAEEWFTIPDIIIPFPNKSVIDVSDEMKSQGYTPKKMFELADDFYSSMGLMRVPQTFWDKSVLQNPNDGRDLVCSASAWDFFLGDDVRIKQCTEVTQNDLSVLHHEMGHIQSYLQHRTQPWVYRFSPNSGFDEAIGDVMALSILTPKHLQSIGLLKNYVQDEETRINKLFLTAVEKLVFLPYAFTLDKYRWSLFRGEIEEKNWNCEFWKLRDQYCGVEPPVVRTEKSFDAPAKYHVSADIDYIRYFVAYIMEFQFYKTLCTIAGQYDPANPELPMDNCDLYGSKEAGEAFKKLLVHGSSKPWPDVLEEFNGERKMSGDAIAEYFEPLRVWLEAENKKNNISIGWTPSNKCTPA